MARIYSSRQLLDPTFVNMMNQNVAERLQASRQDRANLLNKLSGTVAGAARGFGKYIDESRAEEKQLKEQATRAALLGDYGNDDPVTKAVADRFIQTGDPSQLITLRQIQETNAARAAEAEERKNAERNLAERTYKLAVQSINSSNDPSVKISAIRDAIQAGEKAGVDVDYLYDMLKAEQGVKIEKETKAEETKTEAAEKANILSDLKDAAAKLENEAITIDKRNPDAVADFNQRRNELQAAVDANAMTKDVKVPSALKTIEKPTSKELNDGIKTGKYTHKQARVWGFTWDDKLGEYR